MIRLLTQPDGSVDLHVDAQTAGYLSSLLTQARPRGSAFAPTHNGIVRVHVHGEAAPAPAPHEPIEAK